MFLRCVVYSSSSAHLQPRGSGGWQPTAISSVSLSPGGHPQGLNRITGLAKRASNT